MGSCLSSESKSLPVPDDDPTKNQSSKQNSKSSGTELSSVQVQVKDNRTLLPEGEEFSVFTNVVKQVVLVMLRRMTTTLGFEYLAFNELAAKTQRSTYMDLVACQHFDSFFKRVFDMPSSSPEPEDVDSKSVQYKQRKFECLLDEAEDCEYRNPLWGANSDAKRASFTLLQDAAKQTVINLEDAANYCDRDTSPNSRIKPLKVHLLFFARAFRIYEGDIFQNLDLFYNNIDRCTNQPLP